MNKPKKESTLARYKAMQKRFNQLYNEKRLRYDDCIQKLMDEFFIYSEKHVRAILQMELE